MNNQSVILSKDITSGDITPLISAGNVLLTSRPSLNQLTNVAITDPTDNQVLTYDAGGDLWYNADSQGGGGGGGDGEYVSYNITGLPNIPTTFLSNPRVYFSLFDTAIYNTPFIVNYNLSNGLTLNSNGLITGLNSTKTYEIEFAFYSINGATSVGILNMGLYNDIVGNEGSSLILSTPFNFSSAPVRIYTFNPIITGQTQVNPVLKYEGTIWVFGTMSGNFSFNATLKITEVSGGGGGGATTLTALTDVAITEPTEGEALTYNATTTKWENSVIVSKTELNQLDDVSITTPANGQYLQFDTSLAIPKWVNKTPSYLSYSVNAYPLNSKFTAQTFFSIFATSTFNTSPAPVYNYNFSNGITLSTDTGLITGLDATKTYIIDIYIMKITTGSSTGLHTLSLFTDAPDAIPAGTAIILNTSLSGSAPTVTACFTPIFNAIITGQTQICPTLKYNYGTGVTNYTGSTSINGFNATINIREL
jgi:hypothetical protein